MAEVTKRHRELAICTYWAQRDYREIHNGADYVDRGDPRGIDPRILRQSQALADIEAEALAAAPQPVKAFAQSILHGDEKHRAWLLRAAEQFDRGEPVERPDPQPVKAEDERERAHLLEGARLLRAVTNGEQVDETDLDIWLDDDAQRILLSAVEPGADAEEGRR